MMPLDMVLHDARQAGRRLSGEVRRKYLRYFAGENRPPGLAKKMPDSVILLIENQLGCLEKKVRSDGGQGLGGGSYSDHG